MQFGIFSVSDITRDPVSGETPSEAERIDAITRIAQKTEEVGLDVFAIGEHHNPPFFSSSPTTLLDALTLPTSVFAAPEDWSWCYDDDVAMVIEGIQGHTRIPPSPMLQG